MQYFGGKQRISKQLSQYLNLQLKDGTHLEEEAKEQEEEGIIEPEEDLEEDYNEEDDEDWIREYGNTDEIDDYSEENEYN